MAPVPVSGQTLRALLRSGPFPPPRALAVVRSLADEVAERHRSGAAHGAIGLDTVVLAPDGRARLLDPRAGADTTSLDAYERDTKALGALLSELSGGNGALPAPLRALADRTRAGTVLTPAAFAAEAAGLGGPAPASRPAAAPHAGPPAAPAAPPPAARAGGAAPRRLPPRQFDEASLDDLFGRPVAGPADDEPVRGRGAAPMAAAAPPAGLPPELDPRRPVTRGTRTRRRLAAGTLAGQARSRRLLIGGAAALVALVVLIAVLLLVPGGGKSGKPTAAGGKPTSTAARSTSTSSSPTASKASGTPSAPAQRVLAAHGVSAYDPDGDGSENDAAAHLAIDHSRASAWVTDRYTTASLGNLKPGVGLVVDLGGSHTVREVKLAFGVAGTSARLFVGDSPSGLESGSPAGSVSGAGPTADVRLNKPVKGRYLLVWLTALPPVAGGGYRGSISDITVVGTP